MLSASLHCILVLYFPSLLVLIQFASGAVGVRMGLSHTPDSTWCCGLSRRFVLYMLKVAGLRKA